MALPQFRQGVVDGDNPQEGNQPEAMSSLAMLVAWEISKERNACVFRNQPSTSTMIITKITDEAVVWCIAGAKAFNKEMSRE